MLRYSQRGSHRTLLYCEHSQGYVTLRNRGDKDLLEAGG